MAGRDRPPAVGQAPHLRGRSCPPRRTGCGSGRGRHPLPRARPIPRRARRRHRRRRAGAATAPRRRAAARPRPAAPRRRRPAGRIISGPSVTFGSRSCGDTDARPPDAPDRAAAAPEAAPPAAAAPSHRRRRRAVGLARVRVGGRDRRQEVGRLPAQVLAAGCRSPRRRGSRARSCGRPSRRAPRLPRRRLDAQPVADVRRLGLVDQARHRAASRASDKGTSQ